MEIARARRLCGEPGVLLVSGPAGVGKTSLAVRLGHLLASRFPDGQLDAPGAPGVRTGSNRP